MTIQTTLTTLPHLAVSAPVAEAIHNDVFHAEQIWSHLNQQVPVIALKVVTALLLWLVGRWLISLVLRLFSRAIARRETIDATLSKYLQSILGFSLNLLLLLGILDVFGVSTTSYAALLAGAGLAIGTAWGGLLTHFAAGVFMQVLRPYKVGDIVSVGGMIGTVKELGLFGTTIVMGDNVLTIMGNNKVFSDTIKNFSALPARRLECSVKIAHSVNPIDAMERLHTALAAIPNVLTTPAPEVGIFQFTTEGPLLCVRPYAHADNYWQVYFDVNKAIAKVFTEAGYPVPEMPTVQRVV